MTASSPPRRTLAEPEHVSGHLSGACARAQKTSRIAERQGRFDLRRLPPERSQREES